MSSSVTLRLDGEVLLGMVALWCCTIYVPRSNRRRGLVLFGCRFPEVYVVTAWLSRRKNVSNRYAKDVLYCIDIALICDQLS
jgi:hypothetical protein